MSIWLWLVIGIVAVVLLLMLVFAIVLWRTKMTAGEGAAYMRELGIDVARLPGRLRRVARDPRTPRWARWWLIGLAIYMLSPIDPIPDFIPVIGYLDEIVVVPLVLRHVRRMIPNDVWDEYFERTTSSVRPSPAAAGKRGCEADG
jgi:uncharacterized membrane protein YkvA (DUF1232 family)